MNNFVVEAIVIRFHLKGRNYVWSNKILAFEVLFCQLGLQEILKWRNVLHEAAFGFWIISIWVCIQKLEPSQYIPVKEENWCPEPDTYTIDVWWRAWGFRPSRCPRIKKRSTWKSLEILRATILMFWLFLSDIVFSPKTPKNRIVVPGPPVIIVQFCMEIFGRDLETFSCT